MSTSMLAWLALGLIAGFIASRLVNSRLGTLVFDLVLGVIGAFAGGYLFTRYGAPVIEGLNVYSILVAAFGATVMLAIYHAVLGRTGARSGD